MVPRTRNNSAPDDGSDAIRDLARNIEAARRELDEFRRTTAVATPSGTSGGFVGKLLIPLLLGLIVFLSGFVVNGLVTNAVVEERLGKAETKLDLVYERQQGVLQQLRANEARLDEHGRRIMEHERRFDRLEP